MEDIRFVLESPQLVQGQKKRPRLVTSCDNCRLKKVKCIQGTPNEKCEACTNAQIPCRFRDRERYFAERSRIMAGSSSDASRRPVQNARASSSAPSWSTYSTPSPDRELITPVVPSNVPILPATPRDVQGTSRVYPRMSFSEYPQCNPVNALYTSQSPNSLNDTYWDYGNVSVHYSSDVTPASRYGVEYSEQTSQLTPLFDPRHPERPHANLMAVFIQAFFDHLSSVFPFLSYENTVERFLNQSLPPMLSSSIAAVAACHVDSFEVTSRGVVNVQSAYCSNAETLVASLNSFPSFDTLHATILLAWAEYKRDQLSAFCLYAQMAAQMAWNLRLSEDTVAQLTPNEVEQNMLRSVLTCIKQLTATAAQTNLHSGIVF